MSKPRVTFSKIAGPRPTRMILRERLFALMDQKRRAPALWVAGPAGSGKTTLVAGYLVQRKIPCLWYQIDSGDADIATFFYYMGLAAQRAAPRIRKALPLFTSEYGPGLSTFTLRFFEALFERLKRPSVLVLDNYQEVGADSPLHRVIRDAVTVVPEGFNLIVVSRGATPPVFARSKASGMLDELGWDDLALNVEETRALVEFITHRLSPGDLTAEMHRKTNGWAAGLLLLLKTKALQPISLGSDFSPEEVFGYFASEIFETVSEEVQRLLIETAFFPAMTGLMASEMTGLSHADEILGRLVRNHDFTEKRVNTATTYHYHSLFREFLLAQARKTCQASDLIRLEQRAAKLLAGAGQVEAAVSLFLESGDWPGAVEVILAHAQSLIFQGRHLTLEQWLNRLPGELVEQEPWLLYWQGASRIPTSPYDGISLFEAALPLFRQRQDPLGTALSLGGVVYANIYASMFRLLDPWIPELAALIRNAAPLDKEVEAQILACTMHAAAGRVPNHPDFGSWENLAYSLMKRETRNDTKILLLIPFLVRRILSGDLNRAALLFTEHQELFHGTNITPLNRITILDFEACFAWCAGKFARCRKAVADALKAATETGVHVVSFFVRGHGCAGALSTGDLKSAEGYLEDMEAELPHSGPWAKELFHTLSVWRFLLQGDSLQAVVHAESAVRFAGEVGEVRTEPIAHLGQALSLHMAGKSDEAADSLAHATELSIRAGANQVTYACHLAQAELALAKGDHDSGASALREAMSLGRQEGYVNAFYWRPEVMSRLCLEALEAEIESDYVIHLARERGLIPREPPIHLERWPWPLKIYTLGRFELVRDGDPLEFEVKAPRKMLSLIKVLVASGSKGLSESQLTDAIWPEAQGDLAHQAFATILHRLRQLLGSKKVLRLRKGHLSLDDHFCWTDAHAFESLVEKADAQEDMLGLQKAVRLYRGPFLGGEDCEPWAISYRERLRSKFLRATGKLGRLHERNGEYERAIEAYQMALETDDLAEELYHHLMLCYHALGRKAEALAVYVRCREILAKILGIKPSQQTQAIYERLRRET